MHINARLFSLVLLTACTRTSPDAIVAVRAGAAENTIVIAHTNDMHAHFRPQRVSFSEDRVGGIAGISAEVAALEAKWGADRVLLLDAGDLMSGTPLDEYEVNGLQGGAMLELLDVAGYDAWTLGNHEFDRGPEHVAEIVAASPIPVLSANLDNAEGGPIYPGLRDSVVLEAGGKKVGVIGLTTPSLARMLNKGIGDAKVVDPLTAAQQAIAALPPVDLVVALSHLGIDGDRELALKVRGIDLIIGAHTHTRLTEPVKVQDTWIVQTGEYAQGVGASVIELSPSGKIDLDYTLLNPVPGAYPAAPRPEVSAFADHWTQTLKHDWGMVVGDSQALINRQGTAESPLGRVVGQALREQTGADVGLYNRTGLRADLPAGAITREELYGVFPFGNEIVLIEVKGSDLIALALRNGSAILNPERAYVMDQEGLHYTFRQRLGAPEIIDCKVGGKRVDPEASYTIATNSYVVKQWEKYMGTRPEAQAVSTGKTALETVEAWMKAHGEIDSVPPAGGVFVQGTP